VRVIQLRLGIFGDRVVLMVVNELIKSLDKSIV